MALNISMAKKKEPTLLQKLEKALLQKKFDKHSKEAYDWLKKEATRLYGSSTAQTVIKDQRRTGRQIRGNPKKINIGDMLFYHYDAKHKDELPYWDSFPLIFLLSIHKNGKSFYGVNLHYIPPKYRAQIFDQLLSITSNDKFDDSTKLRLSYSLLKNVSSLKILKQCFKQYLFDHLKTRPVKIQPQHWEIAMYLPMARWNNSYASIVWNDVVQKSK